MQVIADPLPERRVADLLSRQTSRVNPLPIRPESCADDDAVVLSMSAVDHQAGPCAFGECLATGPEWIRGLSGVDIEPVHSSNKKPQVSPPVEPEHGTLGRRRDLGR